MKCGQVRNGICIPMRTRCYSCGARQSASAAQLVMHAILTAAPNAHRSQPAGLFLGGYYALSHVSDLGVTHILSVVNGEMSRNMCAELLGADTRPIVRHHVDVVDAETSNLLVRVFLVAMLA